MSTRFRSSPSTPTPIWSRTRAATGDPSISATPRAPISCAAAASRRRARWWSRWMRRVANEDVVETARGCVPTSRSSPARATRACEHALPARRHRRGAGNHRGEPAAFRGRAGRSRRAHGLRHRLDSREARRVPQIAAGVRRTRSPASHAPSAKARRKLRPRLSAVRRTQFSAVAPTPSTGAR